MKIYLIAGGMLLTAASVYGITDYLQTQNKKEFKELYKKEPVTSVKEVTLADIEEEDFSRGKIEHFTPPAEEVVLTPKPAETDSRKKKTKKPFYSNASVTEIKPVTTERPTTTVVEPETVITSKAPTVNKPLRKRITFKKFSRAIPKEEVMIEEKKQ